MTRAHFHVVFMKGWCVYSSSVKQCLRSVNHAIKSNLPCKWHRTASTTSGWKSSPAKIFHRNSSGERRLKFIASEEDDDNKISQRRENIAWHREGNIINTATTNMNRGSDKTLQLHCKRNRWREGTPTADASKSDKEIRKRMKFTVKIIFSDATIVHYTICIMHVKNIFPTDWGQPISL